MNNFALRILKQTFAKISINKRVFRKICENAVRSGKYLILMYHRVIKPQKDEYIEPGMYVDPVTFEKQIRYLTTFFKIVSLEKLCHKTAESSERPLCALTFDDGWSDFYTNAYPVLKSYGLEATVFLPTDYIGNNNEFWADKIAALMIENRYNIECLRKYTKDQNFIKEVNRRFNRNNLHELISIVKERLIEKGDTNFDKINLKRITRSKFLDWKQIKELRESNLVNFGSHTAEHIILTSIGKEKIESELSRSKLTLLDNNVVTKDFIPFCYPNGNTSTKIEGLVKKYGYSCAVTTERGWNLKLSDIYRLKRVGIHQDVSFSTSMMIARLAGKV